MCYRRYQEFEFGQKERKRLYCRNECCSAVWGRGTDTDESLILKTDDERCHKETGAKRETGVREEGEKNCL